MSEIDLNSMMSHPGLAPMIQGIAKYVAGLNDEQAIGLGIPMAAVSCDYVVIADRAGNCRIAHIDTDDAVPQADEIVVIRGIPYCWFDAEDEAIAVVFQLEREHGQTCECFEGDDLEEVLAMIRRIGASKIRRRYALDQKNILNIAAGEELRALARAMDQADQIATAKVRARGQSRDNVAHKAADAKRCA